MSCSVSSIECTEERSLATCATPGAETPRRRARLALEQNVAKLEDDAQPQRDRHRDGTDLVGDAAVAVNDDFGFAARKLRDFLRVFETVRRTETRQRLTGRTDDDPNLVALESAAQRARQLEQLALRPGKPHAAAKALEWWRVRWSALNPSSQKYSRPRYEGERTQALRRRSRY